MEKTGQPVEEYLAGVTPKRRREDAERLVDRVLATANDLGLLATEYSPELHRLTGNFPQTFTHLALVQAMDALDAAQGRRAAAAPCGAVL